MPDDRSDTSFLLSRRGDVIVATIAHVPHRHPERVWFEGFECRRLEVGIFFDHLVRSDPGSHSVGKQLVGFELFAFPSDEETRQTMQDLLRATNVSGDANVMQVLLCPERPCESDGAQGFEMQAFVNPHGRVVIAIPEWDPSLVGAFESTTVGAPTVTPPIAR